MASAKALARMESKERAAAKKMAERLKPPTRRRLTEAERAAAFALAATRLQVGVWC